MNIKFRKIACDDDWKWIFDRASPLLTPTTTGIVAYDEDTGDIKGMAAFDNWTETSVQAHLAIDSPMVLRHGLIQEMAEYVFNTAGREIILSTVPASNKKSVKIVTHIGMSMVHSIKDGFKLGVDYLLFELRKEDCRWLKKEKGLNYG